MTSILLRNVTWWPSIDWYRGKLSTISNDQSIQRHYERHRPTEKTSLEFVGNGSPPCLPHVCRQESSTSKAIGCPEKKIFSQDRLADNDPRGILRLSLTAPGLKNLRNQAQKTVTCVHVKMSYNLCRRSSFSKKVQEMVLWTCLPLMAFTRCTTLLDFTPDWLWQQFCQTLQCTGPVTHG